MVENNNNRIETIYNLCVNSTYEEYELEDGQVIKLRELRDLALDGGYNEDREVYMNMIELELLNSENGA